MLTTHIPKGFNDDYPSSDLTKFKIDLISENIQDISKIWPNNDFQQEENQEQLQENSNSFEEEINLPQSQFQQNKREYDKSNNNNQNQGRVGDRFIPNRKYSKLNTYDVHSWIDLNSPQNSKVVQRGKDKIQTKNTENKAEINHISIPILYKSKILGISQRNRTNFQSSLNVFCPFQNKNFLRYFSEKSKQSPLHEISHHKKIFVEEDRSYKNGIIDRYIQKTPFKVLDAPALQDDFYLNLIDWSPFNTLAVGLSSCVYLWSAQTSKVTKLCDFNHINEVSSVSWSPLNQMLSIEINDQGTHSGTVEIWDTVKIQKVRVLNGHSSRVGSLSWSSNLLASGSRDKSILLRDLRSSHCHDHRLIGHKQEVCGIKWSFDGQQLASGGNDNKLFVWNSRSTKPVIDFKSHIAAIKALAWSPHQQGLLASGGGTQDKTIRFWNTTTNKQLACYETGSQVCNLMFSQTVNELISTHGYSQNQIIVWSYPDMEKIVTLSGHSCRVLYLAMSPDGQTIVTGAGDETLRFWNIFPTSIKSQKNKLKSSQLFGKNEIDLR